jgi:hypothetical protein
MANTTVLVLTDSNPGPVYSEKNTFSADGSGVIFHTSFRIRLPLSRTRCASTRVYSSPSTPLTMSLLSLKREECQGRKAVNCFSNEVLVANYTRIDFESDQNFRLSHHDLRLLPHLTDITRKLRTMVLYLDYLLT